MLTQEEVTERNSVIHAAFQEGFNQRQTQVLLSEHGIDISVRHIRRILQQAAPPERTPIEEVVAAIQHEQNGPGQGLGYRLMWRRIKSAYGYRVSRSTVQYAMHLIDPIGCDLRRSHKLHRRAYINRGPNYAVHIDGYDKLKPYGLCIHGAIDGYSRKVLWLRVGPTNNDPLVVASYYLDFVREVKGVPRLIRTDAGTENTRIHDIQMAFRLNHGDSSAGPRSIIIGRSVSNQRIERYWRDLRQHLQFIMNLLKDFIDSGQFTRNDDFDKELVRFCFTHVVQRELNLAKETWNSHYIRRTNNAESPPGVPNVLYGLPADRGTRDFIFPVNEQDLDDVDQYVARCSVVQDRRKAELFTTLQGNITQPSCITEAVALYGHIKESMSA